MRVKRLSIPDALLSIVFASIFAATMYWLGCDLACLGALANLLLLLLFLAGLAMCGAVRCFRG